MDFSEGYKAMMREIALADRSNGSGVPQAREQVKITLSLEEPPAPPSALASAPRPPVSPPSPAKRARPLGRTEDPRWKVIKFDEVYAKPQDKPVLLRVQHVEEIDRLRKAFKATRVHDSEASLCTTDVVNAALDAVFSHPPIPIFTLASQENLSQLICDHVHKMAISYWKQWNEVFSGE